MAQAIAAHLIKTRFADSTIKTQADSAGTFAGPGLPASQEGANALEAMGIPMHEHRSKPITRALLDHADPIFALTRAHIAAILEVDPTAADRVELLDPDGRDIPDPIGGPQSVYDTTARKLVEAITKRFEEMEW